MGCLGIWCCHVKHDIIKLLICLTWGIYVRCSLLFIAIRYVPSNFWLFCLNINVLVICKRHILLDKIYNSLTQADLIVET